MAELIRDNSERARYELEVDGKLVVADYRRTGDTVYLRHVEAPPSLRGTGAAGRLMQGVMERARAEQFRVVPLCGYAAAWIRRHGQYRDLID